MAAQVTQTRPDPKIPDGNQITDQRISGYKEQAVGITYTKLAAFCDEGDYFTFNNPTPGTGLTGHAAATTMDNTKATVLIKNQYPLGGRRIYFDYLKVVWTAAGTTGTLNYATHLLDPGAGYTSGGTLITPTNTNIDVAGIGGALIYAGAVICTAGAGGLQRIISNIAVRPVISVINDTVTFTFGADVVSLSGAPVEGATIMERNVHVCPVIIGPQQWYKLILWRASQTVACAYEIEGAYWER
jgi:hypothetical protein